MWQIWSTPFGWLKTSKFWHIYLLNSLSKEILELVATKEMAAVAWKEIQEQFALQSRSKVTNMRFALTNTKKGTMTMAQYFSKMKRYSDELAETGKILDDEEIVSYILNGLDSDYTLLVLSIMSRVELVSVNELYTHLHRPSTMRIVKICFVEKNNGSLHLQTRLCEGVAMAKTLIEEV